MARLDELERKFEETPHRYFASLANEYRKAGEPQRAAEMCRSQLAAIPGHISGHIVLGQALYDSADFDGSRAALETALTLDPENIVALRYLGDIARDTGDIPAAERWYARTLDADPYNEAATAALQAIREQVPSDPPDMADVPSSAVALDQIEPVDGSPVASQQLDYAESVTDPAPEPTVDATVEETVDLAPAAFEVPAELPRDVQDVAVEDVVADPEPVASMEETPEPEPVASAEEQTQREFEQDLSAETITGSADFEGDLEISAAGGLAEPTEAAPAEMSGELEAVASGSGADTIPAESPVAQLGEEVPGPLPQDAAAFDVVPEKAFDLIIAEGAASDPVDVVAHPLPEPVTVEELMQTEERVMESAAPFVTETMADLYLEQGYPHEALELLLQLSEQRPDDSQLRDKIGSIKSVIAARRDAAVAAARAERAETAETATPPETLETSEPAAALEGATLAAEPLEEPSSAPETPAPQSPPRSVRELFARMDTARPRADSAGTPRAPTRLRSDFVPLPEPREAQGQPPDDPFGFPDAQPAPPPPRQQSIVPRTSGPHPMFDPSTAEPDDFDAWLRGLRGP